MGEIKTNDRFERLTNLNISTHYQDGEFYFMRSSILGTFAHWVVVQSPYDTPDITRPLEAFGKYVAKRIKKETPEKFTYAELSEFICEDIFEAIPEIEALNHPKFRSEEGWRDRHTSLHPGYDFIDLGALARNIRFSLLREYITEA